MNTPVIATTRDRAEAEALVGRLIRSGFSDASISVLFPHRADTTESPHAQRSHATQGVIAGAGAGGVVGGTIGLLAALGVVALPGLGLFLAAGPLLATLSGALAGAGFGGPTGGLIGLGIVEDDARRYEGELKSGRALVSVHVKGPDERARAEAIFAEFATAPASASDEEAIAMHHI
jgi:hypothetical protein